MRVQADVHDPPAACAFGVKLIETEPEHIDAVASRTARAGERVEVVDVVRIRHADDRPMDGIDQIGLMVSAWRTLVPHSHEYAARFPIARLITSDLAEFLKKS